MGLIGQIAGLPFLALSYGLWLAANITRPLIVATLLCALTNPKAAHAKLKLIVNTFRYLVLSKDKKWKKPKDDPASFFSKDNNGEYIVLGKKTVVFLRHGESTWNDTFNKGDRKMSSFLLGFIPGIFHSLATEWYFLVRGMSDESWFFDSPLSAKGIQQAEGVAKFLRETDSKYATPKEARFLRLIKGEAEDTNDAVGESASDKCVLVSSNLRRAISTCAIAMKDRLDRKIAGDKIFVLQELQEASINPDAQSITPPFETLVTSFTDSESVKMIYADQTDTSLNKGNKDIKSNGLKRMEAFCSLLFATKNEGTAEKDDDDQKNQTSRMLSDANHVMCTGHSYWFRAFFQTYLPKDFEHVCKKKKLVNGGLVGFTLCHTKVKETGEDKYMIDPVSLTVLYAGF
mmetsp:Transcript_16013/g.36927  ORF Transcript_16013/g.36927 Transcript_16013/m.36927 type:complete len:402 (-) Transcript_16013:809-2014(-)